MSNREGPPHPSRSKMSGQSTSLNQSAWMGHWMRTKHKQPHDGSLCLQKEDGCEMKQLSSLLDQVSEHCGQESLNGVREVAHNRSMGVSNRLMCEGSNLKNERTDLLSFPIFNVPQKGGASGTQVTGIHIGQCSKLDGLEFGMPRDASTVGYQLRATEIVPSSCNFVHKETAPNLELDLRARDSVGELTGMSSGYQHGIVYKTVKAIPFPTIPREPLFHHSAYKVDASQGPMYAETTRQFYIMEKTAIGMSGDGKIFRESMLSTKFNRNLGGLLTLSPASDQPRSGLKLKLLDCSTDSEQNDRSTGENQKDEGNRHIGMWDTMAGLTKETSAETQTMDVGASLENNHINDLAVSMSNQDVSRGLIAASSKGRKLNTGLPDMNVKAPAPDGSSDKEVQSASRTQSLNEECILSLGGYPSSSKPHPRRVIDPGLEAGNRWVKRLKMSSSKFPALGTKSSTIEEVSSCTKLPKLSSNLLNSWAGLTGSEPTTGTQSRITSCSKKAAGVPKQSIGGKTASTYSSRENSDTLLSHSWIRRWRHIKRTSSPTNQPAHEEPSDPDTLKTTFDHFPKKTFPSIAAMALMGKAMNGFQPCEFTKKGSFIVWNTNNLPSN